MDAKKKEEKTKTPDPIDDLIGGLDDIVETDTKAPSSAARIEQKENTLDDYLSKFGLLYGAIHVNLNSHKKEDRSSPKQHCV